MQVQTYVHLSVGLVAAQLLYPGQIMPQALVVIGAGMPDVPSFLQFLKDKKEGKKPLKEQSEKFIMINNIFHSFIVWLASILVMPIFIGAYSHLLLDWLSHKGKGFEETDPSMLWPFRLKLRGIFEYRKGYGKLFSPPEIVITILCISIYFWLL